MEILNRLLSLSKKTFLILIVVLTASTVLGYTIISNIYRGSIPVSPEQPLQIMDVTTPESITVHVPFTMYIKINNPNPYSVRAKFFVNFTLINPSGSVTVDSIKYFGHNNFTSDSRAGEWHVEGNSWIFHTPPQYEGYNTFDQGVHVYYIEFQLETACERLDYEIWLAK